MNKIQVYFTHHCQIQYYDHNATEQTHEFRFQNLVSLDKHSKEWDVEVDIQSGLRLCPTQPINYTNYN
jgi:hypothetical protein